jgi:O-antigen/teichoic acid export membrane protein
VYLAISFTGFFGVFTTLGVSTYMVRAVARDRTLLDSYISNAFGLRIVMSAGVLVLVLAIARLLNYSAETQAVILILGLQMVLFTISNVFESGLQAMGQMSWRAIATAIGQMLATGVGVGLLLTGADAITYALSLPLGTAIQLGIVLVYYFRHHPIKWSFNRTIVRALLIGGMPLFLWTFLQSAYGQIDATLLSLFADKHVIGWFASAAQITSMLIIIPSAVTAVALPVLCELYVRPGNAFDRAANRATVGTLLVMAPIGAGLAISSADLFRLLNYPEVFQNATLPMSLLALALPVTGVMMVVATLAVAIGQEKQWLKISVFAVCVFPPLYVVLIWFTQSNLGNGAIGASLANLLGESSLLVWGWIVLPKRIRQPEVVRPGLEILALCGAMVLLVAGLRWAGLSILLYVPAGALFYLVGAWLLKLVTPQDIDLIKETLRRRTHRSAPATLTPAASLEPPTL